VQLSYLDLYLVHWPVVSGCSGPELRPSTAETWAALEGLVQQGLVRSIGLSNFSARKIQQLLEQPHLTIKPAVLQVGLLCGYLSLWFGCRVFVLRGCLSCSSPCWCSGIITPSPSDC
jgi:hypothetical protein